jgi:hypothetical protein
VESCGEHNDSETGQTARGSQLMSIYQISVNNEQNLGKKKLYQRDYIRYYHTGFRQQHSTMEHVHRMSEIIGGTLEENKNNTHRDIGFSDFVHRPDFS